MRRFIIVIAAATLLGNAGCRKNETTINETGITVIAECKGAPGYLPRAGFLPGKPFGFSVAEKGTTGLSLVQFPSPGVPYKSFRLPGWDAAGHLGAVVTDRLGNSYVIPRPFINTLKNDPGKQNTIYKVDSQTGEMSAYITLSSEKQPHSGNPYGLMGLAYDCETDILYATSVAGSDVREEAGSIYAISIGSGPEVIATLAGIDAMGIGLCYLDGQKALFVGRARSSEIYSLTLSPDGGFEGEPVKTLTLETLGDRGDDKPRKIRFDTRGNMLVSGISFNFNLANSADKKENIYTFGYDAAVRQWRLLNIRKGVL
ncbi:hypothetical protein [Dyadobacter sp. SG02]|uniref:hypothetical protein n=1 Tax=Dyadobacter sp. SG02 TaxID=1855291 RepID=UPI00115FE826|nr:hypothetical protein [Dyadobacter sp. SG02]